MNIALISCPACDEVIIIKKVPPDGDIKCECGNIIGKFAEIDK